MDDLISLGSYETSVANSLLRCFATWSRMPPEVWAEEVYRLPDGRRFRWDYCPYARAMFLSMFDRKTLETVFELYSRGLKSTVVLLAIGFTIDQAPRRILSLWPTNSQAEKWSKDNLCGELLDTTPALNFLGSQSGRRIASNTLLHKLFPGGLIDIFGANAPGDMRRAKGSFLYGEEIDAIESTETDEGDQLAIFNKRGDEYPDTIRVFASYPSVRGYSKIHAKIEESDFNQWRSTCVKCGGEPFTMHRSQLRYEKGKPETALFECPRCKGLLTDSQRYDMAHRQGFDNWKPTRPFRGKRGFQANAMLWPHPVDTEKFPGGFLQMLAQQEIDAENAENPKRAKRVLVNTVDAEPFDPTEEGEAAPEWKPIYERREDYGLTVPAGGLFITAFADLQLTRIEVGWKAWGRKEESFGLDHVVLDGHIREPEVWKALGRELCREWTHESGAKMRLGFGFADGGTFAEDLYRWLQELARNPIPGLNGHIRASKGIGQHGHPIVDQKMRTVAKTLKGHHIGTWEAKERLYERFRMERTDDDNREGQMHWNRQFTEEYFQQMTVEQVTITFERGLEIRKYINPKQARNEALDIEVGNLAALRLRPRNWDMLEAELKASIPDTKPVTAPTAPVPARSPRSSLVRSVLGGWDN